MATLVRFIDPAAPETEYRLDVGNFDVTTEEGLQALRDAMAELCSDPSVVAVEEGMNGNLWMGESLYFYAKLTTYPTLQDYVDSLSGGSV
ncbi:hypothetical protein [Mycobacterium phage Y10]|uniref:Uncharacterized protein n=4 Tax=Fionnbharthvirus fionnbharth TaxID=2955891 RepID=A0A2Z5XAN8_9CAUD|nr:hypothetical protein ACQ59_gp04 [Mycobacterium phage Fionnbharth]ASR87712.1 hypothetical protein WINTERMUTE_4 [Mycobacterium phage Wintermute]QGH80287.1 hypothetical protein SEA_MALTHUS_4 [Mycobacterium phage Malthus]QJD52300.1 hypothetical protein PBI_JF1_4 [Mycobacterium phage JF1]WRQ08392.1 hypothetical protein JDBV13_00385 [Mycobacterium phage june]BBC43292.1 hypothetical protein [Mycobacterium phage Y10]BBC43383.1 hypothetical protein [Mycobacterium phage Y2]